MSQEGVPPENNEPTPRLKGMELLRQHKKEREAGGAVNVDAEPESEKLDPVSSGMSAAERILVESMERARAEKARNDRATEDMFIQNFPDHADSIRILAERERASRTSGESAEEPGLVVPAEEEVHQAMRDASAMREPGESSDPSSREVEDRFIIDFPDSEESKKILARRAQEQGESRETLLAGEIMRSLGLKARGAYERLSDRARETVTRLYDRVKLENDSRSLLRNEEVFRAQAQFYGEPERQLQQIAGAIAAEQQVLEGNAKTRAKLLEIYPNLSDSELGRKLLEEDETAKRSMAEQESREPEVRAKVLEMKEAQVKFKAEQARQAASVIERIDTKLEPLNAPLQAYRAKSAELNIRISNIEKASAELREQLESVNKSADAHSPDSAEFKIFLRRSNELKAHLAEIDKDREDFTATLAENNVKLEGIQAQMKPWEEKRKVYEGMIVSELSQEQIEKGKKSLAEAEAREQKKDVIDQNVKEKEKEKAVEETGTLEDHLRELKKFLSSSGISPERQEAEYERLRNLFEENADSILAVEQQEEDRSRAELEQEYAERGIPPEIAWGPEESAERRRFAPAKYIETWNRTVKDFQIAPIPFLREVERRPSGVFEIEELDEKCRDYFRELYRKKYSKRLDWRYNEALEEGIKKMHLKLL